MGGVLHRYTVMQQSQWAGRRFFSAQDRRTGQAVYLIEEPVTGTPGDYNHPGLPPVEELTADGDVRWLIASMPEGDTLEDLRREGALTEKEIGAALLSVLDGLMGLAALEPPVVPAYLDPACIKRDWMGRWTLDYLALAHATEARRRQTPPLGVYPFGALLYWLATGEVARFTRVQPRRVPGHVTPVLQFITMRCLGQAYPGLAELRADVMKAVKAHDFRPLAEQIQRSAARAGRGGPAAVPLRRATSIGGGPAAPGGTAERGPAPPPARTAAGQSPVRIAGMDPRTFVEQHRVPVASRIPLDDRPWALPPRPPEGYRKYTVPPPPNPVVQTAFRWSVLTLFGLAVASATGWGAYRLGLVPDDLLPPPLRPAPPAAIPAEAGVQVGARLSPEPTLPAAPLRPPGPQPTPGGPAQGPAPALPEPLTPGPGATEPPGQDQSPASGGSEPSRKDPFAAPVDAAPSPAPPDATAPPADPEPQPEPSPQPQPEPQPAPQPEPAPAPEPEPDQPPAPEPDPQPEPPAQEPAGPAPGSVAYLDKQLGAIPVNFHLDGRFVREVYMFPHDRNPYISLEAFNEVTGRSIVWVPVSGGRIRLLDEDLHLLTYSYYRIRDRIFLKLGPELQAELGLQLIAYNEEGIFFATAP